MKRDGWGGGGLIVNIFFGAEIFSSGIQIFSGGVEKFLDYLYYLTIYIYL